MELGTDFQREDVLCMLVPRRVHPGMGLCWMVWIHVSMDIPQSSPCTKTTQVLNVKGRGGGTRLAVSRWLKAYLDKFIY